MRTIQSSAFGTFRTVLVMFATNGPALAQSKSARRNLQTAKVLITTEGFSRASVILRRGVPTRITFLRQTDATCDTEVSIPAYGVKRTLPLDIPVVELIVR